MKKFGACRSNFDEGTTVLAWLNRVLATMFTMFVTVALAAADGKITEEAKRYWAYQPVKRPAIPDVTNAKWVKNPVDAFILSKLEAKGLTPSKPADPIALIRRVTYDLTGLPLTPAVVDEFVQEFATAPDTAYEKLIDRLLQSPHYGEKWGRHWLDLVRYAETNGYERDSPKPHAWRYRDYVIRSFNADKPFDRFIQEQLAGDEIDRNDTDCVIATGYYRLGLWDDEPADPKLARFDELDDWVATTAQVFLGMSMNCAHCHDHKLDPIPHADYYKMLAFFQDVPRYSTTRDPSSPANLTDITPADRRVVYEEQLRKRNQEIEKLSKVLITLENEAIKKMPATDQRASEGPERPTIVAKVPQFLDAVQKREYSFVKKLIEELRRVPPPAQELALSINNCFVKPAVTNVLLRGNPNTPAAKVEPGFPKILNPDPVQIAPLAKDAKSSGRRIVLANWIASKDNPMTARVAVNRIWQHHFGRGIVPTPNDFGKLGEKPTHPELLDWLATEFVDRGWSFKNIHKLLLLSNAYQMSSAASEKGQSIDPGNSLLWRFNMRRLSAEEVRDSILAVSGKLNLRMFGPSIYPRIPREVLAGQSRPGEGWPTSSAEESVRRGIYVHVKRSLQVPILAQFDQADTDSTCPVRYTTTVPTQALGMLNGEFSNEQAGALADRLMKEPTTGDRVKAAIRLTTSRTPSDAEVRKDTEFVQVQRNKHKLDEREALQRYCLMLLNANEFVYLD